MTPNRQSPAYAILVHRRYPAAQQFDIGVISPKDGVSGLMVLVSPAYESKSEDKTSTAQGGVARKF